MTKIDTMRKQIAALQAALEAEVRADTRVIRVGTETVTCHRQSGKAGTERYFGKFSGGYIVLR